jgi:hypothetical protein
VKAKPNWNIVEHGLVGTGGTPPPRSVPDPSAVGVGYSAVWKRTASGSVVALRIGLPVSVGDKDIDTKAVRQTIRLRKQDQAEREEAEALLDLYMNALGMV